MLNTPVGSPVTVEHPDAAGLGTAVYSTNDMGELTGAYLSARAQEPDPCDGDRAGRAGLGMTAANACGAR
jgi:hypothetical protein